MNQSAEPLTEASYVINSMQSALASAERGVPAAGRLGGAAQPALPQRVDRPGGRWSSATCPSATPDRPLMKDISFARPAGAEGGHRGATGAGKTTLINLLMRFYEVDGGADPPGQGGHGGHDRENLRDNFGMVLQDTWLFDGTIAENIAYGKPEATREEIIAAARTARVDFFVRTMPKGGYDTVLGARRRSLPEGKGPPPCRSGTPL